MSYPQALDWLFAQTRGGAERGTARLASALLALGNPHHRYPAIHVLGTNGKGSVVAYLEAALRASGTPFGATTSPHLSEFSERIRSHHGPITPRQVVDFVAWARQQSLDPSPAFFDWTTAMALHHFAEVDAQWALVEAGVGGKNDATNLLTRVAATVLTNVGEDHLEVLGGSLEAVARDKSGAFRPGVPVFTAVEGPVAQVVRQEAAQTGAPLFELGDSPLFALPVAPALAGKFQRKNAALAVAVLRHLGFPEAAVRAGLQQAVHPGRLQRLYWQGVEVVLDGAHNPHAVRALVAELPRYHLVFGVFARKDYRQMQQLLLPQALSVQYTRVGPGAVGQELGQPYWPDPYQALEAARQEVLHQPAPILVTGSLYLAGALLPQLAVPRGP